MIIIVLGQNYYLVFGKGQFLNPLLFKIFLVDPFFVVRNRDIASYAGDSTPL